MQVITLLHQLEWSEACLQKMKQSGRPQKEVDLQESVVFTISERIKEKESEG
jgi:hypothetical protein